MPSVHDNHINSYEVDFENEILIMKTVYSYKEPAKRIDVIFSGYLVHLFSHEKRHSILSEIEEYPLSQFLDIEREYLEVAKKYFWPIMYETEDELLEYLQKNNYKSFLIGSSFGLSGWVLSKKIGSFPKLVDMFNKFFVQQFIFEQIETVPSIHDSLNEFELIYASLCKAVVIVISDGVFHSL